MSYRDHFRIGPLRTVCHVYEGDGTRPIAEENLRIYFDADEPVFVPEDVRRWRQEIEDDQRTRAVQGADRRWNHPRFAVETVAVTRTNDREDPIVEIRFSPTDYFTFLAAQQLDRRLEEGEGAGHTLREHYLAGKDPITVNGFLSSSFGANVAVVTGKDNRMLFSRRSATVGGNTGRWNSSANEGLSGTHDLKDGVPDLFGAAHRALREELAVHADDECTMELLSFAMDTDRHQWAACFLAVLPGLSEEELRERWSRGVDDKWEHSEFRFVPAEPDAVLDFLLDPANRDEWTACGPALFFHAIVRTMTQRLGDPGEGRLSVERAIAPAVRRAEKRAAEEHGAKERA
ncbi:translation initiation factor 2 [Streptomyces sp. NPDC059743]|uniref:translation initiation factor 2 n=1 Tax=Streptomyces sp. NPDC059743 TaxID=3346928 RepID=UPI00364DE0A0